MFYCQHVLGMGHLVRSTEIVRALSKHFKVLFAVGGETSPEFRFPDNVELFQLKSLKTDPEFANLQVCDASLGLEETKAVRQLGLLRAFDIFRPNVVVTELFPFGRKQFSFELMPLLQRAHDSTDRPLIVSSIRDVLVTKQDQAKHEKFVTGLVNSFYDLVLVHGDEKFIKLDDTFSRVKDLNCAVGYTGYVVQQEKHPETSVGELSTHSTLKPTIVVSNGSGASPSGHHLLESVVRAAPELERVIPHELRIFAGPLIPEKVYRRLEDLARPFRNVRLASYTPDLPGELGRAKLSVSMAGYNTVMDILSTGVRALVYPMAGNGDQEQSCRAAKLATMGVLAVLDEGQLQPRKLVLAIRQALGSEPSQISLNFAGAENSAALIRQYLRLRNTHAPQRSGGFPAWTESGPAFGGGETQIAGRALCG
jgi:predicted glycosyltransferase